MTRVGTGKELLTSKDFDEPNPKLVLDRIGDFTADGRKDLMEASKKELQRLNLGIGSKAHRSALERRREARRVWDDTVTTVSFTIASHSSLATGLGNFAGSSDLGMELEGTIGVPRLRGSALRGVTRAYACVLNASGSSELEQMFGSSKAAGTVSILDSLIETDGTVGLEVLTPHFGPWYESAAVPGEWFSPVPVPFIVVQSGTFLVDLRGPKDQRDAAIDLLGSALDWLGIGGKTSSGFGVLERNN